MPLGTLVWSFAKLTNMDLALEAIRQAYPDSPSSIVAGAVDGNVYWRGTHPDPVLHVAGICRGIAFAMRDGSVT